MICLTTNTSTTITIATTSTKRASSNWGSHGRPLFRRGGRFSKHSTDKWSWTKRKRRKWLACRKGGYLIFFNKIAMATTLPITALNGKSPHSKESRRRALMIAWIIQQIRMVQVVVTPSTTNAPTGKRPDAVYRRRRRLFWVRRRSRWSKRLIILWSFAAKIIWSILRDKPPLLNTPKTTRSRYP